MLARFFAVKIFAGLLLLTGCATAPHTAPRFDLPSTVEIRRATIAAKTHIQSAQKQVVIIGEECPQAKEQVVALSTDLDGALSELQTSEGSRVQLDAQLSQQTTRANQLATDYDKAGATITSIGQSRHGWVKRFWIAAAVSTALLAWTFRKPLLLMAGGIGI